jgi:AcrR family transcriptional regulator
MDSGAQLKGQMNQRRVKQSKRRQRRLSAKDWVDAATDLLINNNVNAIEIPNLSRRLGVTKGSFYWHFDVLKELLNAILKDWQKRMTSDVSLRAEHAGPTVESALQHLLGLIRKPRPSRNSAVERSIRDWARTDAAVRTSVIEVDEMRLAFFEDLFRRRGFSKKEACIRAYAAYAMMMGDSVLKETIDFPYSADEYVETAVQLLLGRTGKRNGLRKL